jgi:hypothetical protein
VRESPASKDVKTEADGTTALEAVTRRQPVKTQTAAVNCRVCELAIAL